MKRKPKRRRACPEQRRRGGQPGNQNAVKHGYYSSTFNTADRFDLNLAADMEGISEEIALLRFEIKKAITGGDIKNLVPLVKATVALEKLIRTNHKIYVEKQDGLKNALKNVVKSILLPMDSGNLTITAVRKWAEYAEVDINTENRKTKKVENEANLTYNQKRISSARPS